VCYVAPLSWTDLIRALNALRVMYRAVIVGGELSRAVSGSTDDACWFVVIAVAG
jgi:hypothetical protein